MFAGCLPQERVATQRLVGHTSSAGFLPCPFFLEKGHPRPSAGQLLGRDRTGGPASYDGNPLQRLRHLQMVENSIRAEQWSVYRESLPGLQVVPRGVAFRYKGKAVDPVAAGRALNGQVVVTGRVAQVGDRLTVATAATSPAGSSILLPPPSRSRRPPAYFPAIEIGRRWISSGT